VRLHVSRLATDGVHLPLPQETILIECWSTGIITDVKRQLDRAARRGGKA
jgi:hypothetical protein